MTCHTISNVRKKYRPYILLQTATKLRCKKSGILVCFVGVSVGRFMKLNFNYSFAVILASFHHEILHYALSSFGPLYAFSINLTVLLIL